MGAADSVPGTIFTATGVGSGTGTATAVGTIVFNGKVSCVVEPPGLPVVYDNDGLFAVGTAPAASESRETPTRRRRCGWIGVFADGHAIDQLGLDVAT